MIFIRHELLHNPHREGANFKLRMFLVGTALNFILKSDEQAKVITAITNATSRAILLATVITESGMTDKKWIFDCSAVQTSFF